MTQKLIGRECRFALHIPKNNNRSEDTHLIKVQSHYEDGSIQPEIIYFKDFKRPFWITKKAFQNHKNKKEWAPIEELIEYKSTQSDLAFSISKATNKNWGNDNLHILLQNPYIYGASVPSTSIIKHGFNTKYSNLKTLYSFAVLDIETDMLGDLGILMITVLFKNQLLTVINKGFVEGLSDVVGEVDKKTNHHLKEYIEKYNLQCKTIIVEDELECIKVAIKQIHKWMPDFLAIWNITFDLNVMLGVLEKREIPPEDIFSDPSVPKELRLFEFKKGREKRITASGVLKPIPLHEQWHTVYNTASFWFVDAMSVYYHNRLGQAQEQSYSLDAILTKELGIHKLKIPEIEGFEGAAFHMEMQSNYKIEYIVYNRFDCIGMMELEESTKDLSITLPMYSRYNDFSNYDSQPTRAANTLYFYLKEKGYIIASTGKPIKDDLDDETLDLSGWIAFLKPHLMMDVGLCCLDEAKDLNSLVLKFVADLDVAAAYPHGQIVFNVSKETTKKEILSIEGIDEYVFRKQNINLLSGHVNSIEYCTTMFGFPAMDDLLKIID